MLGMYPLLGSYLLSTVLCDQAVVLHRSLTLWLLVGLSQSGTLEMRMRGDSEVR